MEAAIVVLVALVLGALAIAVYFLPAIIAIARGHAYAGPIFALNLLGGWTGLAWCVALVWSLWPEKRSVIDPLTHDPTGRSARNVGHSAGEVAGAARRAMKRSTPTGGSH